MRKKKVPTVTLVVKKYDMRKDFEVRHAERILDRGKELNGGWELPEDSSYYYDEYNGLRLKSDKGDIAEA